MAAQINAKKDAPATANGWIDKLRVILNAELQSFLRAVRVHAPQKFAPIALGFATGLCPSSLRPLRRSGKESDL